MKTAISVQDELLQQADAAARRMGLSRSRLFALAVSDVLNKQRSERMLRQLNEAYSGDTDPEERSC